MDPADKSYPLILVTGAAGWLGRRVLEALAGAPAAPGQPDLRKSRLRCLVLPSDDTREMRALGVEVVAGDLCDPDARLALMKEAEGALVLHLAGVVHAPGRARVFDQVNHRGTLALFEDAAAARVARFVAMSSNSPMGANPSPEDKFTEDSPYNPYMGYGRSKHLMELGLKRAAEHPGMPEIVIVRAPWFYGPGQPPRQTQFFTMVRTGKFPLMSGGRNRRSMAYIDSLAAGLVLCGTRAAAANRTYWIADERPYPMREVVDTVRSVLKEDFGMLVAERNLNVPGIIADVARLADGTIQALGLYHQKIHVLSEMNLTIACDISRAKAELGYRPLVELREGMRRSVEWCLKQGLSI